MAIRRLADTLRKRASELPPRIVLAIGFAAFVLYAFPGYMSTDSVQQLVEARALKFSDGHPPSMALVWSLLDRIISGPLLMLLLQGVLFLGGLYYVLRRFVSDKQAAWLAIGILLFPPVLTPMATIWKDSQMAAYLVAGTAAMIQPRLRTRVIGLGLMLMAVLMRHNALVAVAPLIGFVFEWRNPLAWWKRIGIMIAAAVIALGALFGASRVLASRHMQITPVFYDIMAMIAVTHDRSDDDLREVLRDTPLFVHSNIQWNARRLFEMRGVWRVTGGDDRFFDGPTTEVQWQALDRAWKQLISDDPGSYVRAHWIQFARVLGISELPRAPVMDLFIEVPESQVPLAMHDAAASTLQEYTHRVFYWLADYTPLFRPWAYAAIALLLLALVVRDRLTFALILSGLLYELSFIPAFAEPDYRYSHWMITAIVIAAVILVIQRRRRTAA